MKSLTRRFFLKTASLTSATFGTVALGRPASADEDRRRAKTASKGFKKAVRSQNGWTVQPAMDGFGLIQVRTPLGVSGDVLVRVGEPESILLDLIRRVHYYISEIQPDELSGWYWSSDVKLNTPESNFLSGTAIRIRPGARVDAYTSAEEQVLRTILQTYDGLIGWGGDFPNPDQSVFYLVDSPRHNRAWHRRYIGWRRKHNLGWRY